MRKNKTRLLLAALVLRATAEVGYRAYVSSTYRLRGHFYWPSYACERNRPAIARLFALVTHDRTQRAFAEVRGGRLADSVGHLSGPARALLLQVAHDVAPSGYLFFNVEPVPARPDSLRVTAPCLPQADCHCLGWLQSAQGGGYLFQLSTSGTEPRHTNTQFEYVRVSNPFLQIALQQSSCYAPTGHGDFLNAQGLPAGFALPYNEDQTDLLITRVLRADGLL